MTNNCPKCAAFDIETKARVTAIFSREEITFYAMQTGQNIAATLRALKIAGKQTDRMFHRQNVDFLSQSISKWFVSMEEKDLAAIKRFFKNPPKGQEPVEFTMNHERCPHKEPDGKHLQEAKP
jgi:hypothetical protein